MEDGFDDGNEDRRDLCAGLDLTEPVCRDDDTVGIGHDHTHGGNGKLTENDDDGRNEKAYAVDRCAFISARGVAKRDERYEDHELICKRVHKFTEVGDEIVFSCEMSIYKVSKRRKTEECGGNQTGRQISKSEIKGDENHEERNHEHSEKGQLIGQIQFHNSTSKTGKIILRFYQ